MVQFKTEQMVLFVRNFQLPLKSEMVPFNVPSSIMSLPPNSEASLYSNFPYFGGTAECFAISDIGLKLPFLYLDPEPKSVTRNTCLLESMLFRAFSKSKTKPEVVLFRKTSEIR